jgi:hypothetical protein
VLFLALIPLCYLGFGIWQQTFLLFLGATLGDSESTPALLGIWIILLGFGFFGLVMVAEPYLRGGVRNGQLLRRFARLAIGLAAVLALGIAVQQVIIHLG